ncbi:MAG TPA: hypothetical protein VHG51_13895 [Longimicrobiaceae bacterium]|nr:hypothetical protein [Longimicrobiaceae bacterium]
MRALTLLAAAALAAACTPRINTDPDTGRVDVDMQPVTQSGEVWNAALAPQGGSGVTGTSTATVRDDHTVVTITVSGAPAGGTHPWHVHEGTCGSGGSLVGPPSAYPPLQVAGNGAASAEAHLMLRLNEARRYHVNVHASPTEMGNIVACGELDD